MPRLQTTPSIGALCPIPLPLTLHAHPLHGVKVRICASVAIIGGGANSEHEKIPHIVFSRHYAEGVPERKTICGIFLSLSYTSSIIAKGAASPLRSPVLITRV